MNTQRPIDQFIEAANDRLVTYRLLGPRAHPLWVSPDRRQVIAETIYETLSEGMFEGVSDVEGAEKKLRAFIGRLLHLGASYLATRGPQGLP